MTPLVETPAWKALLEHKQKLESVHLRTLFAEDPQRFSKFSLELHDLFFDYSKNRITGETRSLLVALAEESGVRPYTERMFNGEKINFTEDRAVLHVALRNRSNRPILVD